MRSLHFALLCLLSAHISLATEPLTESIAGSFTNGAPILEIAPGEPRLGRVWGSVASRKHPYSARGSRVSLKDCIWTDGTREALALKTSFAIAAQGGLHPDAGTFAVWIRLGDAAEKGGFLATANAYPTGGPLGTVYWALGVTGPNLEPSQSAGRLFLRFGDQEIIAEEPLPKDGDWHHLAAVWSADQGAKLYLDGRLLATNWAEPATAQETKADERVVSLAEENRMAGWKVSVGSGDRRFHPLKEAAAWTGSRASMKGGELEVIQDADDQRLQLRSTGLRNLPPGNYAGIVLWRAEDSKSAAQFDLRVMTTEQGKSPVFQKQTLRAGVQEEFTESPFIFQVQGKSESSLSIDLNFQQPGHYLIRDIILSRSHRAPGITSSCIRLPRGIGADSEVQGLGEVPVERLVLHEVPEAAIKQLRIFDTPLSEAGIHALFAGTSAVREQVEPMTAHAERREKKWFSSGTPAIPLTSGKLTRVREACIAEAREDLRAAGWLAVDGRPASSFPWWYHGYRQDGPRQLHLRFSESTSFNWISGLGAFQGKIEDEKGSVLASIDSGGGLFQIPLPKAMTADRLKITQQSGQLGEISFLQVEEQSLSSLPASVQTVLFAPTEEEETPAIRQKLRRFDPLDRLTLMPISAPAKPVTLPALRAWHIFLPPEKADYPLGSIGLVLPLAKIHSPVRLRVQVQDSLSPFRQLAEIECEIQPTAGDAHSFGLLLDLRDTIIPTGRSVWLTMRATTDLVLAANQALKLWTEPAADPKEALALWRDWELNSARDRFESLSEPRPWSEASEDPESKWWLSVLTPEYEHLDKTLSLLREKFPADPVIESYYQYTHPQIPNPTVKLSLPSPGAHPPWAFWARENLLLYKQFVDWWIDHRQASNGEFGHSYKDDTDLVQDWVDLSLICDPSGKYASSVARLAEGVTYDYKLKDGSPLISDGLNNLWQDALHAYEEGLNTQSYSFLTDYGNPTRFQWLLDTASRYDQFLLSAPENGVRRFAASGEGAGYISSQRAPEGGPNDPYWYLLLHPGLMASWYARLPELDTLLAEVGAWTLQQSPPNQYSGRAALLQALFDRTGDINWLKPLFNQSEWATRQAVVVPEDSEISPNTQLRIPGVNAAATLEMSLRDASSRYADLKTETMGGKDHRYLKNWMEWKLSGDRSHLVEALIENYKRLQFSMPALTIAEQSGDRVPVTKQLISQMYLGGVPNGRNRNFEPDFAVSYSRLGDNFAALVLENQPKILKLMVYSFSEKETSGKIHVWQLVPGCYRIREGFDTDGDGQIDEETSVRELDLVRGDAIPVSLSAQREWLLSAELVEPHTPLAERGDAAIDTRLIRREGRSLIVPVVNLSTHPIRDLILRVRDSSGRVAAEKELPELPGILNWKLGRTEVSFDNWNVESDLLRFEVDAGKQPEITLQNNFAEKQL